MAKHNGRADGLRAARDFFAPIIQSDDYKRKLKERLLNGDLAPQAEMRAWEYVFGKPVEQVALTREIEDLDHLSTDELFDLCSDLQKQIRLLDSEDESAPPVPVPQPSSVQ